MGGSIITFEINDKHPVILNVLKQQEFEKRKMKLSSPFYLNIIEMNKDKMLQYEVNIVNNDENILHKIHAFDSEYEIQSNSISNVKLKVTPSTSIRMIQNKISLKLFNYNVPPNLWMGLCCK